MRPALTLLLAAALCAVPWLVSEPLTGYVEPWDYSLLAYGAALLLAGLIAGLFTTQPLWAHAIGCGLGQFIPIVFLTDSGPGPLFPIGIAFLGASTVPYLCGVLFAGALRPVRREAA